MPVCWCVCVRLHKHFVHDSDHKFCPIFLIFGAWVAHVTTKCNFDGQVPGVNGSPFYTHKTAFWLEPPAQASAQRFSVFLAN